MTKQQEYYLDNAATTIPCKEAVEAACYAMTSCFGNPSSLHRKGFQAEQLLNQTRATIAKAIVADPREIIFTSGATESNTLAIIGAAMAAKRRGHRIVTTTIEHPSVLASMDYLASEGFEIVCIPPKDGVYTAEQFAEAVDEHTILVSMMLVNNEVGLILPVFEAAKQIKRKYPNIIVHCDAVQGFMKVPVRMKDSSVDLLSFSGHKIYAPKGVGALYIKRGVRVLPIIHGGGQQQGVRSGTESVPLIAALGAAVSAGMATMPEDSSHAVGLNTMLRERLKALGMEINSPADGQPYILNICPSPNIRSEIMLHFLEERGVYVSSGSACSRGKKNYVLDEVGVNYPDSAIRVSLGRYTTKDDIEALITGLTEGVERLATT